MNIIQIARRIKHAFLSKIKYLVLRYIVNKPLNKNKLLSAKSIQTVDIVFPKNREKPKVVYSICGKPIHFIETCDVTHDDIYTFNLKNVNVVNSSGLLETENGNYLIDNSWYNDQLFRTSIARTSYNKKPLHLTGTSLLLASEFANNNYGHFLLDCIGRIAIFNQVQNENIHQFDQILINGPATDWKKNLLSRFHVDLTKIYWLNDDQHVNCESLVGCSFPGFRRNYPKWHSSFLHATITCDFLPVKPTKRLFVSRKNAKTRQLLNERELLNYAKKYGFELYYPEDSRNPMLDFYNAEAVIGAHGSGLTDVIFMQPKSRVLELIPTDHQHPYFYTLGKNGDLIYELLQCRSEKERRTKSWTPSPYDFYVDEDIFRSYLENNFT
jgi:capsular polysaccharide biosynthesis protein